MSYLIETRLDNGSPSVLIIEAATRRVRLRWHYDPNRDSATFALQQLFRNLALLSCQDKLSLLSRIPADACLSCDQCFSAAKESS